MKFCFWDDFSEMIFWDDFVSEHEESEKRIKKIKFFTKKKSKGPKTCALSIVAFKIFFKIKNMAN